MVSVTPGNTYTVVVGAGSGDSYFIDNVTVKGAKGADASTGTGGAGGSSNVGDVTHNGGAGASVP